MKIRTTLSALLIVGLLAPAAYAQSQKPQTPAAKALKRSLAAHPRVARQLKQLSVEQRQALRDEVRSLVQQSRAALKSGTHKLGDRVRGGVKLRLAIRKAIKKAIGKGGF